MLDLLEGLHRLDGPNHERQHGRAIGQHVVVVRLFGQGALEMPLALHPRPDEGQRHAQGQLAMTISGIEFQCAPGCQFRARPQRPGLAPQPIVRADSVGQTEQGPTLRIIRGQLDHTLVQAGRLAQPFERILIAKRFRLCQKALDFARQRWVAQPSIKERSTAGRCRGAHPDRSKHDRSSGG